MATGTTEPSLPGRTRLAAAGASAATRGSLYDAPEHSDRLANHLFRALLLLGLGFALAGLTAIVLWALIEGGSRMNLQVFTGVPSTIDPGVAGFRTAILGTIYVIAGVVVIIVPLGIGTAVYLEEYADRTRWYNRLIDLNIQNLAGVPSIVFGILGLAFIARGPLGIGPIAAAGSLTLALLVLPTIILASREAIRAVPSSIRDGALALGATPWQTIRLQVLPVARPGILTGVILSIARAVGEAAPLLLVGAVTFVTFNPRMFSGGYSTLPVMIYQYFNRPQESFKLLAAAGVLVMLVIVLVMNSFAVWLRNRYERQLEA
jgi:phosphate transport system permease protein